MDDPGRDVALVAGGTGGIGGAVVRLLTQRGTAVVFTYRANDAGARALAAQTGAQAEQLDLTDGVATAALVQRVVQREAGMRTLVYAAGPHVPMLHLSRVEPAQLGRQLVSDAAAFFGLVHAALPALRRSQGSVVAVTTAALRRFAVRDGLSVVPKAAVEAVVRGIAAEEGRFGVRANCVAPGMLTDGTAQRLVAAGDLDDAALDAARRNTPLRRFGTADEVAHAVCFLASAQASFVTGQTLAVDGGYSA